MAETATKVPVATSSRSDVRRPLARSFFPEFDTLRQEIDRVFDGFGWPVPRFRAAMLPGIMDEGAVAAPAVDVAETEKAYSISAELPGLEPKDVEIKLSDSMLTIRGEKKSQTEETRGDVYVSERRYGAFERSFAVPMNVDREKIEAQYDKGVLHLVLPKMPEAQKPSKKIEVKVA